MSWWWQGRRHLSELFQAGSQPWRFKGRGANELWERGPGDTPTELDLACDFLRNHTLQHSLERLPWLSLKVGCRTTLAHCWAWCVCVYMCACVWVCDYSLHFLPYQPSSSPPATLGLVTLSPSPRLPQTLPEPLSGSWDWFLPPSRALALLSLSVSAAASVSSLILPAIQLHR